MAIRLMTVWNLDRLKLSHLFLVRINWLGGWEGVALGKLLYEGQRDTLTFSYSSIPKCASLLAPCDRFGEQRSLPVIVGDGKNNLCLSVPLWRCEPLWAPFPACSASRSACFLHAAIRFSLSVPLTHFRLFEGTVELPCGCSSAFREHGWAVELRGWNGNGTPETHGGRVVLEVHPPLVCFPVFGCMFFSRDCCPTVTGVLIKKNFFFF